MAERKVNFIVAVIILTLTACGVLFMDFLKKAPALDVKLLEFPMQVGEWAGKEMPMDKRVYEILGTDKVLLRQYADNKDERVWIAVVYGEQNRQSFHPPEYCYLGGGNVELLDKETAKIVISGQKSMDVNKLIFLMGNYKQLVLYWFTAGDLTTDNYYKQQFYFVMNQLKHRKSGGTLVRVSTTIINDDVNGAVERCKRFILEALKILPSYL
jgi:EpsI family protein